MNSRLLKDWILIIVVFAAFAGIAVLSTVLDLPQQLGVQPGEYNHHADQFLPDFQDWALVSLGVSLFAAIFWYVIGEWGPAPSASNQGSMVLIWLIGLIVACAGGIIGYFYGPVPSAGIEMLTVFYVVTALFAYYVATMLFSPVNVKFVVPGSKLFRRW